MIRKWRDHLCQEINLMHGFYFQRKQWKINHEKECCARVLISNLRHTCACEWEYTRAVVGIWKCACVSMRACAREFVRACVYASVCVSACVCVCVSMRACAACVRACMRVLCVRACAGAVRACVRACVRVCACERVRACVRYPIPGLRSPRWAVPKRCSHREDRPPAAYWPHPQTARGSSVERKKLFF